jgi:hypothetical protein
MEVMTSSYQAFKCRRVVVNKILHLLSGMKWLILFLLPLSTLAQTLPPGTYRDLKPDKPLVLDTGSYTFINLEMKDLGKGIWLDGRKARKLVLSHCRFYGNAEETALLVGGDVTISHSQFISFSAAITYQEKAKGQLLVYRNRFENNQIALSLQNMDSLAALQLAFGLKCNEFINQPRLEPGAQPRVGLRVGKGVVIGRPEAGMFHRHELGSEEHSFYDAFAYPNGNLWPTLQTDRSRRKVTQGMLADLHHPDTTLAWPNSPNWISIDNQSGSELTYHRYENEFVGWGSAISGPVYFRTPENRRNLQLLAGRVTDSCAYIPLQPKGQVNARVCEQLLDEQPFLLPTFWRQGNADKAPPTDGKTFLGEPEPLAEKGHLRIMIWLSEDVQQAVLQYLDKDGATVLQNNPIQGKGWKEAHLDLTNIDAGEYTYRLLVNGTPSGIKKLVVVK